MKKPPTLCSAIVHILTETRGTALNILVQIFNYQSIAETTNFVLSADDCFWLLIMSHNQ